MADHDDERRSNESEIDDEDEDEDETDELELERTDDRSAVAEMVRTLANALTDGRSIRVSAEEYTASVAIPERIRTEVEVEYEADSDPPVAEFELELEWDDPDGSSIDLSERESDTTGVTLADESAENRNGRTSRFEVYEDRAEEWRWRLVHWNGNIVADSGEGYASRSNARRAVRNMREIVPSARLEDAQSE
ncbi:amphi-Trp domain-containing protein [Natronorubrum sediminis]|uniref:Amphi-Trp domain-containing protein n=1 Tax=Natronorubrum sediminis TaxID=640943 RepID=A0A1H6G2C1_9EURY|nr:amphi-Trp domain-containing protein [Natronorubrum sediminis]SEH16608.1 amphi-Trp domain-containing protein [Natronorubrum sediminis]